ncbi:hypothetical protein KKH23_08795 [Patescibacteria group bacterium]|nr:hypothetical protein [Patescibacteria group bacterium]
MFQFLTCVFKIHNPSAHKRKVMDFALEEYTRGYAQILETANVNLLRRQGKYVPRKLPEKARYTGKSIARMLTKPDVALHSSAKDSLIRDVAGNLASYLALEESGFDVSYPVCRDISPTANEDSLDHFIAVGSNQDDYDQSKAKYRNR